MPPGLRSPRLVLSAAGFIATSTSGASPGVWMSWSAKWTWKPETPGSVPAGARISAGKSGKRREVVADQRRGVGELRAGELHAVAGVAGEADHDVRESALCDRRLVWLLTGDWRGHGTFFLNSVDRLHMKKPSRRARFRGPGRTWPDVSSLRSRAVPGNLAECNRVIAEGLTARRREEERGDARESASSRRC